MHLALSRLTLPIDFIAVDGNQFHAFEKILYECNQRRWQIPEHSRSLCSSQNLPRRLHEKIHEKFPQYYWNQNKGYPTKVHRTAIAKMELQPIIANLFNYSQNNLNSPFDLCHKVLKRS